jgi:hypothetical protein
MARNATRGRRAIRSLAIVALLATAALTATPVSANTQERFGPTSYDYTFIGFNCLGFDIVIHGTGTDRATVFFGGSGEISKVIYDGRFPHDVLTNSATGRSIVVRGEFQEFIEPVPGTDQFMKTVVGFRYMVNAPGTGSTIREVGRISFADLEQTIITFQAGKHDLALDVALSPTFCAALA